MEKERVIASFGSCCLFFYLLSFENLNSVWKNEKNLQNQSKPPRLSEFGQSTDYTDYVSWIEFTNSHSKLSWLDNNVSRLELG